MVYVTVVRCDCKPSRVSLHDRLVDPDETLRHCAVPVVKPVRPSHVGRGSSRRFDILKASVARPPRFVQFPNLPVFQPAPFAEVSQRVNLVISPSIGEAVGWIEFLASHNPHRNVATLELRDLSGRESRRACDLLRVVYRRPTLRLVEHGGLDPLPVLVEHREIGIFLIEPVRIVWEEAVVPVADRHAAMHAKFFERIPQRRPERHSNLAFTSTDKIRVLGIALIFHFDKEIEIRCGSSRDRYLPIPVDIPGHRPKPDPRSRRFGSLENVSSRRLSRHIEAQPRVVLNCGERFSEDFLRRTVRVYPVECQS